MLLIYWSTKAEISDAESVSRGEFSKSQQNGVMSIERNIYGWQNINKLQKLENTSFL